MAVVQKGIAVAWGLTSSGYAYSASATALNIKGIEQSLTKDAQLFESKDNNGETNGLVFFDPTKEIGLRCYPSNTTIATAKTAAAVLPAIGDKFTITDADDATIAGDYVVMRVSKTKTVNGRCEFDIAIKQWATDLSATVAAS